MSETRSCEQCGEEFKPRREHARFCSARCRVAWNRQHVGDPPTGAGALGWTITAMRDTVDRLLRARASDRPHGFAAVSEAVWWVTLVDATLVRYHPEVYNAVLAGHGEDERCVIEGTFGGLRFVRNWMGYHLDHSNFVEPQGSPGARPDRGLDLAVTARTRARDPPGARAGVGDDAVPGVPGPAGRAADRGDLRPRGGLPAAGLGRQPHSRIAGGIGTWRPRGPWSLYAPAGRQ